MSATNNPPLTVYPDSLTYKHNGAPRPNNGAQKPQYLIFARYFDRSRHVRPPADPHAGGSATTSTAWIVSQRMLEGL
jgi:hypothetical protein